MSGPVSTNTTLSHYRIVSKIGAGGMGEVYRARDTRLDREVAIKLLPAAMASDSDRLQRFAQEARATSALNHPNILTIYDIGTHEEKPFIVAELLDGSELREVLNDGPLPLRKALDYAQQVAQGLAAAHEKGIVHRDLKPENLFVTHDGRIKILDFGLAKLRPQRNAVLSSEIETQKQITDPGTVMGTVGYMSPEQVRGHEVDHRSDIFSFGSILYEMLSGKRAFRHETMAETMTAILKEEVPELIESNPKINPQLDKIVRRCLEKQPARRFQTTSDLGFALEALSGSTSVSELQSSYSGAPATLPVRSLSRERVIWGVGGLAVGALLVGIAIWLLAGRSTTGQTVSRAVRRMTINLRDGEPLALAKFGPLGIGRTSMALSPDGSELVYAVDHNGKSQLYLRAFDQFDARPISGTDGAYSPFFSPDGRSLGFFSGNKLKKLSLQGGEPVTLCEARIPHGATWGPDDTIVFADSEGVNVARVSASGGKPEILSRGKDRSDRAFYPEFLPGGKAVLFSIKGFHNPDYGVIALLSLATGERRVLLEGGTNPRYAASGHIVFARAGAIMAVPFDLSRLEVTGSPVTLIEGVRIEEWGAAQFTLSPEGTLVYVSGGSAWIGNLTWVDHQGNSKPVGAPAQAYGPLTLSPDGQRVALTVVGATSDVYVYDLTRNAFNRLTTEGWNYRPVWTPDGKRIIYQRGTGPTQSQIVSQLADGSGGEEVLSTSEAAQWPSTLSSDGKVLAFQQNDPETGMDLYILPLDGDRQPYPWLKTKFNEWGSAISRDGKWIAYTSDESGQYEVYVRPFSGSGGKRQISVSGGEEVTWSPDGRTLFYREGQRWMSVAVQTQPDFSAAAPKFMFEGPYLNVPGVSYDVAPDGQRFMMLEEYGKQPPTTHLNVVLNWFEELKQRVPAGKK
jgi:eukaryotic-like serine/threonine-protein kinase